MHEFWIRILKVAIVIVVFTPLLCWTIGSFAYSYSNGIAKGKKV